MNKPSSFDWFAVIFAVFCIALGLAILGIPLSGRMAPGQEIPITALCVSTAPIWLATAYITLRYFRRK
jgi:hypothetical protein